MYAFKGDRIYVRDDAAETMREAEVIEVEHVAGHPPYWVRWADTDELELWFPEADVVIELDRCGSAEADVVIATSYPGSRSRSAPDMATPRRGSRSRTGNRRPRAGRTVGASDPRAIGTGVAPRPEEEGQQEDVTPPAPSEHPREGGPVTRQRADVLLSDGTVASIRPVTADDGPGLIALHDHVGPENTRLRFFSASRVAGHQYVAHVLASPETLALVAVRRGELVGLATAEPVEAGTAEIAFIVVDECHGLGIGGLLLEHLAAAGRDWGISRFVAEVLGENVAMLEVLRHAGFAVTQSTEAGCVHVEMDTTASYDALRAADERECLAEARSLAPLLRPTSVAVVGARRDGTGVGAAVLRSIVAGGFTGSLHAVHRVAESVLGVPAVRRLVDLETPPDLVVVAVPATQVLTVLRGAARAGCPSAVVVSAGFAERGAEGVRMQQAILDLARASSMRVVGPNCLGVQNTHPAVRLDATFSGLVPPAGGLALASQSGGVGIVLADLARRLGVGVGMLVSLGDKVDVSGNDLLAAWRDDPHVTAAALYLESFGNAFKFARVAREFSERKPLLAVVGGRSATPRLGVRALFAQAGVIGCDSVEEMAECALLLGKQPRPAGRRVALLTNAGGMGVLAADAADAIGLAAEVVNAGAAASPQTIESLADELLASTHVDALVVLLVASALGDAAAAARLLPEVRRRYPDKPVLLVPLGGLDVDPVELTGVATFRSAAAALRALEHAAWYDEWRREPRDDEPLDDPGRAFRARAAARDLAAGPAALPPEEGWLDALTARSLLSEYGLGPEGLIAAGSEAAVAAADELGYPVVVKLAGPAVGERTERGLVRVGLTGSAEVAGAVAAFEDVLGAQAEVLVQPVVRGTEIALGVVRDPRFGPLVTLGAGGVAADLWEDRVALVPPFSRRDAARAIRSLKVWPLLQGFRGAPGGDVGALEDLLVRLGRLTDDVPALAEADLDPVVVGPDGCHLVDVKVRLDDRPVLDAGVPRRLRRPE
ncbi:GNAT family N-acetyltransferase [Nocardioides sp.]|uniref:GNAT family N-acetyltransferase n=1 Tax=Nocardioides sp. TaxID=35761 RepID=UPI003784260F